MPIYFNTLFLLLHIDLWGDQRDHYCGGGDDDDDKHLLMHQHE
jgi:hypothetical protein